ncbi:MAG: pantetheine-phosphate adenylyltransferase [Bacillota bacterium]|nr:pantetheine-phosphate adenylyltransferase [Bacillota bacterium]
MKNCVYPGSFDPITNGHIDVIKRSSGLFDKTIVAVLNNERKESFFSVSERVGFIRKATEGIPGVEVDTYDGLLADYMQKRGTHFVLRGLRAISDFEYEFQMAAVNSALYPDMETVFLMPSLQYSYLSSSIVREVGRYGGSLAGMLPECIIEEISERLKIK